MPAVFPVPQPGELVYSVIARFGDWMGFPTAVALRRNVLGTADFQPSVAFPTHLDALVRRLSLPWGLATGDLVEGHTLLPYYRRFVSHSKYAQVEDSLRTPSGAAAPAHLGLNSSRIASPPDLRYCHACLAEARSSIGEGFWTRVLQLPGVLLCPIHGEPVHRTAITHSVDVRHHREFISLERALSRGSTQVRIDPSWTEALSGIAEDSRWLLEERATGEDSSALRPRLQGWLAEAGLILPGGERVRLTRLRTLVQNQFPAELLRVLGCPPLRDGHDWLWKLLRGEQSGPSIHALKYMVVWRSLGLSGPEFLGLVPSVPTDGTLHRSAPCRNPLCSRYEPALEAVPLGSERVVVHCRTCDFEYSVTHASLAAGRWRVHNTGATWDQMLRHLVRDSDVPLKDIADTLGISRDSVYRHARRVGVWRTKWTSATWARAGRGESFRQRTRTAKDRVLREHQRQWLALRERFPLESRSELAARGPAYNYLMRFAPEWINANLPPLSTERNRTTTDWSALDEETMRRVQESLDALLNPQQRPARITVHAIGRAMGDVMELRRRLPFMPRTAALVESAMEDSASLYRRRVIWAVRQFAGERRMPGRRAFIRRIGGYAQLPSSTTWVEQGIAALRRYLEEGVPLSSPWGEEGIEKNNLDAEL